MDLAQEAGARTVITLPISIASHSPLMEKASLSMKNLLEQTPLQNPRTPIIGNVNADILRSKEDVFIESFMFNNNETILFFDCSPGSIGRSISEYLYFLGIIPILILFLFIYRKWQKRSLLKFCTVNLKKNNHKNIIAMDLSPLDNSITNYCDEEVVGNILNTNLIDKLNTKMQLMKNQL